MMDAVLVDPAAGAPPREAAAEAAAPRRLLLSPTWAVIPARGGSKGIPRKNIRPLGGVPLIGHAIRAAKASRVFDRVLVSTEDAEIAEVAKAYGAEVPYMRPIELATDSAPLERALFDLLDHVVASEGVEPKAYAVLLPTFPFRTREMIVRTVELLRHSIVAGTLERVRYEDGGWFLPGRDVLRRSPGAVRGLLTALRPTGHVSAFRYFPPDVRDWRQHARRQEIMENWIRTGDMVLQDGCGGDVLIEDPILTLDLDEWEDWAAAEWILRERWFVPAEAVA